MNEFSNGITEDTRKGSSGNSLHGQGGRKPVTDEIIILHRLACVEDRLDALEKRKG